MALCGDSNKRWQSSAYGEPDSADALTGAKKNLHNHFNTKCITFCNDCTPVCAAPMAQARRPDRQKISVGFSAVSIFIIIASMSLSLHPAYGIGWWYALIPYVSIAPARSLYPSSCGSRKLNILFMPRSCIDAKISLSIWPATYKSSSNCDHTRAELQFIAGHLKI